MVAHASNLVRQCLVSLKVPIRCVTRLHELENTAWARLGLHKLAHVVGWPIARRALGLTIRAGKTPPRSGRYAGTAAPNFV